MENEKIKELKIAIGALSEMSGMLRDNLISNGFSREEACAIVSEVIKETMRNKS